MRNPFAQLRDLRILRWVVRSQSGDRDAFRQLYRALHGPVWRYVRARVPSDAQAEDVVAEVFFKLLEALPRFDPSRGTVVGYVLASARNALVDRARTQPHVSLEAALAIADPSADAEYALSRREEGERLQRAMAGMDEQTRELLSLRYVDGLRHADIAAVVGLSDAAVRQRLSRAVRELKAALVDPPLREELPDGT